MYYSVSFWGLSGPYSKENREEARRTLYWAPADHARLNAHVCAKVQWRTSSQRFSVSPIFRIRQKLECQIRGKRFRKFWNIDSMLPYDKFLSSMHCVWPTSSCRTPPPSIHPPPAKHKSNVMLVTNSNQLTVGVCIAMHTNLQTKQNQNSVKYIWEKWVQQALACKQGTKTLFVATFGFC